MFGHKERINPLQKELDEDLENMRDDCIALFLNSGLTQQQIYERGGPTPKTISKWLYKETRFPRISTIQSFAKVFGMKLIILKANSQPIDSQHVQLVLQKKQ